MKNNLVCGVGINDTKVVTKDCPLYYKWTGILRRCYVEKFKIQNPSYKGCSVCGEWLCFSNFNSWAESQNWKGMDLDKDILKIGNNIYCPEYCCFVPRELNILLTVKRSSGHLPIGVTLLKKNLRKPYSAQDACSGGKRKYLGYFETPYQAHRAWQENKIKEIQQAIVKYSGSEYAINEVIDALYLRTQLLTEQLKCRQETKYL